IRKISMSLATSSFHRSLQHSTRWNCNSLKKPLSSTRFLSPLKSKAGSHCRMLKHLFLLSNPTGNNNFFQNLLFQQDCWENNFFQNLLFQQDCWENNFFQNLPQAGFKKSCFPVSPRRRRGFSMIEQRKKS